MAHQGRLEKKFPFFTANQQSCQHFIDSSFSSTKLSLPSFLNVSGGLWDFFSFLKSTAQFLILTFSLFNPRELKASSFGTGGLSGQRATACRCLLLVSSP